MSTWYELLLFIVIVYMYPSYDSVSTISGSRAMRVSREYDYYIIYKYECISLLGFTTALRSHWLFYELDDVIRRQSVIKYVSVWTKLACPTCTGCHVFVFGHWHILRPLLNTQKTINQFVAVYKLSSYQVVVRIASIDRSYGMCWNRTVIWSCVICKSCNLNTQQNALPFAIHAF